MRKGSRHTEETIKKLSLSHIGLMPWNTGKKLHYTVWNKGKKGVMPTPWNKGKHTGIKPWLGKKRPDVSKENHHNWNGGKRNHTSGYIQILSPNHPFKDSNGYVFEHRLVIEKRIGRYLKKTESVHHINGIKDDNRDKNLRLFKNESEHHKFHWNLQG
jgi:hypothetical protein